MMIEHSRRRRIFCDFFVRAYIKDHAEPVTEFDSQLWASMVECVTVGVDKGPIIELIFLVSVSSFSMRSREYHLTTLLIMGFETPR